MVTGAPPGMPVRIGIQAEQAAGFAPRIGARLPLHRVLLDQAGRPRDLAACLHGQPGLVLFAYGACPDLCPLAERALARTLAALPANAVEACQVVLVDLDARDGASEAAERARVLASAYGQPGGPGFHVLTGPAPVLAALEGAAGVTAAYDPTVDRISHATGVLAVAPDGRIAATLPGLGYAPGQLARALAAARGEAPPPPERPFLLRCFHLVEGGRHDAAVLAAVRALGVLTVGAVAALLVRLVRRKPRSGREAS